MQQRDVPFISRSRSAIDHYSAFSLFKVSKLKICEEYLFAYVCRMKKLLILFLTIPCLLFAQETTTIDLTEYGLKASIVNNTSFSAPTEIIPYKNDKDGHIEISLKFENGNRLDIETIPKPMTAKVVNAQLKKMMTQKHEGITFKVIKWTATEIMFSRTKKGSTIFKSMFLVSSKGKEIMVSSNDVDDEKTCQALHAMAKTFKLN